MSCCNFLDVFVPALIGSVFAGRCGTVDPGQQTVAEGTTVQFRLTEVSQSFWIQWYYVNNTLNLVILLCDSKTKHCEHSNKYTLSDSGYMLSIKTVTHSDSGDYLCYCYNEGYEEKWSLRGTLNVKRANKSSSNEPELHRETISTESTKEYHTMTNSATAKVESKTVKIKVIATSASNEQDDPRKNTYSKSTNEYRSITSIATVDVESETVTTEVIDTAMEHKVSSTLEDTSQGITIAFAGGVAVGVLLTIIVVVIIRKKRKKDDIHRGRQKPCPTQTLEGTDGQRNSMLLNESNHLHRREPSEQEAPALQLRQEDNPDDQEASSAATEQTDSKYETIIPVTDRAVSIQEREMYKMIKVEEEGIPEYETVA